ncbi:hypothetical protein NQ318_008861 [Aromia moschata]|uniref:ADP-ribosylation factor-like protein 2-binding protein n=1 Tax=Aromia moschata TaxID=1265417 RepID=A0AAV8ZA15_9CUCU|nr:hypothetical protein NQ318_008861 [Aromia moschata]
MIELNDGIGPEELNISNVCTDQSDKYFAQVIGCIEGIIIDEEFINLRNKFMDKYWREFDTDEENKLVYMDIFKNYITTVEAFIEERLSKCIRGFDMDVFEFELEKRKNELDGEIFEILTTFSDFRAFKSMFLDYKAMKEGTALDFSREVSITKYYL